jgi:uncharacterized protein
MAFPLYDATVANYLQILDAAVSFLDKSLTYFREKGIDPLEVVEARLAPDMLPFRFQIVSVAQHSRASVRCFRKAETIACSRPIRANTGRVRAEATDSRPTDLVTSTPRPSRCSSWLRGRKVRSWLFQRTWPGWTRGDLLHPLGLFWSVNGTESPIGSWSCRTVLHGPGRFCMERRDVR